MKSSFDPRRRLAAAAPLVMLAWLTGCAGFSADGGFTPVAAYVRDTYGMDVRWRRSADEETKSAAQVAELRGHPLSVEDAVQIALLENHDLQASFEELGVSEADVVQSGRLPNPRFTWRHAAAGGLYAIEATVAFNVLSLLTTPYAHATELRRFAQVQDSVIIQVVQLADRTRTAYYDALAAHDSLEYARQVKRAAQTGAELANRMLHAGNWNRLDQSRQEGFYTEAQQGLARAELADAMARAELDRLLATRDGQAPVQLPQHMPDLPQSALELRDLERTALQGRIDLKLKRGAIDELARRLKLTKATRFVDVLAAGPARVREGTSGTPFETGYEVSLEVPVFDTGAARVRRAEAIYKQALERFAQAAIDARSEVDQAAARYRAAYQIAVRERDDVMPRRKMITQQDLLLYNASQLSVFDLLDDARAEIAGVNDYLRSTRDFWVAKSRLDTALVAGAAFERP